MKNKLDLGRYERAEDVARDIRLIWSNCILYNSAKSEFGVLAANLAKKFEERYAKVSHIPPRGTLTRSYSAVRDIASGLHAISFLRAHAYVWSGRWCYLICAAPRAYRQDTQRQSRPLSHTRMMSQHGSGFELHISKPRRLRCCLDSRVFRRFLTRSEKRSPRPEQIP